MNRNVIVDIGGLIISNQQSDILKTYALGSCVGVTMYCPRCSIMGMAHIALPDSTIDRDKALVLPGYYADTAIPFMISHLCCRKKSHVHPLIVHLIGGASAVWCEDTFQIGRRNLTAIERLLDKYHIKYNKKETGGFIGRTVEAEVGTGLISVYTNFIRNQDLNKKLV